MHQEVRLWVSQLLALGVLPLGLLLATTGLSVWAFSALLWLLFTVLYVAFPLFKVSRFLRLPVIKRMLWHAGLRLGYVAFASTLWFILGLSVIGLIALLLPLVPDSLNVWYISPRTRKHTVMNVAVVVFVILFLMWLEYMA